MNEFKKLYMKKFCITKITDMGWSKTKCPVQQLSEN